jgi:hypothetical protein
MKVSISADEKRGEENAKNWEVKLETFFIYILFLQYQEFPSSRNLKKEEAFDEDVYITITFFQSLKIVRSRSKILSLCKDPR